MIKIKNRIYNTNDANIENMSIDELRVAAMDTINWIAGRTVKKAVGETVNISASNSKAIAMLAKVIFSQSPDLSGLTDKERASYDALVALADAGYSDSELLLRALTAVQEAVASAAEKSAQIASATTVDEIIAVLES